MKRTRIKPVNPERRAKTYARAFGDKADWIRAHPCCVPGCRKMPTVSAHAIAQGRGAWKGNADHQVPMCQPHHYEAGEYRTSERASFEVRHRMDRGQPGEGLVLLAVEYDARWHAGEDVGAPW